MKNINKILKVGVFSLAFSMTACDFLDTTPFDFTSPEMFYQTEEECNQALTAIYSTLSTEEVYGNNYSLMLSNTDDLSFFTRETAVPIASHGAVCNSHDENNERIFKTWVALYDGINNANVLLEHIDAAEIKDEKVKNRIKGEAKFLRAYYHFLLVQAWHEVPIRKKSVPYIEESYLAPTPHADALDWIIQEMEDCIGLVDNELYDKSPSRIKQTIVEGILARVCLWRAGYPSNGGQPFYEKAATYANNVIISQKHKLNQNDIMEIWKCMAGDKYETVYNESMWEAEFYGSRNDGNETYGRMGNEIGCKTNIKAGFGRGDAFYNGTSILWNLYSDNDKRRDLSMCPYEIKADGTQKLYQYTDKKKEIVQRACGKFRREWETNQPHNQSWTPENFPILRYADVLLMHSEALLESGKPVADAIKGINEVRKRAGITELKETISTEDLRKEIRDERARELCFEALRKYDLIRWGIYVKTIKEDLGGDIEKDKEHKVWPKSGNLRGGVQQFVTNTQNKHQFLPIPRREISVNKDMVQNAYWK